MSRKKTDDIVRSPIRDMFPDISFPPPGSVEGIPYIWGPLPYLRRVRANRAESRRQRRLRQSAAARR